MIKVWIILKIQTICLLCKEKSQGSWLYLNRNRNSVQSRSSVKKKFVKVFLCWEGNFGIHCKYRTRFILSPPLKKNSSKCFYVGREILGYIANIGLALF